MIRQLLETFVQLRYFVKHPQKFKAHFTSLSPKGRVLFKIMFDEFSPGYYGQDYRLLSNVAHGGAAFSVMSGIELSTDGSGKATGPLGVEFNDKLSSWVVNQTLMLVSGYLRCFPDWFPSYAGLVDAETEGLRTHAVETLDGWRKGHKADFPKSHRWHERSDLLMGASTK